MKSRRYTKKRDVEQQHVASFKQVDVSTVETLRSAIALHLQGALDEAAALYTKIVELQPDNVEAIQLLATIALQQKNFADAVVFFERALVLNPDDETLHNNLGIALHQLTRYEEALLPYNKAISCKLDYVEAYFNRGNTLLALSRYSDALQSYQKAVEYKPDYAEAYYNCGIVLAMLKRHDEALQSYDKAIAVAPAYTEAYYNRGIVLHELRRFQDAVQSYDQAIALNTNYAEAYCNRGNALFALQCYDESLTNYDQALAIKHDYPEAYANRKKLQQLLSRQAQMVLSAPQESVVESPEPAPPAKPAPAKKAAVDFKTVFTLKNIFSIQGIILLIVSVFCFTPWASPPLALLMGLIAAQLFDHPFMHLGHKVSSLLLKASVVGLGFGINFESAVKAGSDGLLFTIISIFGTLLIGYLLGKLFKVDQKTSYLISSGTAICGGSAIAAISPVIDADENQVSLALGTVFILNAVALFLFPEIGKMLHMTQHQFGLWAAIAIHDTSSVVGAAAKYGHESLLIATTVKLARSLWILPMAILSALFFKQKINQLKAPWFIAFFVGATLFHTYLPQTQPFTAPLVPLSKSGLTLTLFMIGTGLSINVLKKVGPRPLVQGILTWIAISVMTLIMIMNVVS